MVSEWWEGSRRALTALFQPWPVCGACENHSVDIFLVPKALETENHQGLTGT